MKAKTHTAKLYAFNKPNKKGEINLYVAVTINRKTKYLPLKLSSPVDQYDFTKHQLLKKCQRDKSYNDNMMIITREIGKCNDIFVNYRLRDQSLSMEMFLEEYHNFNVKKDFISYMDYKIRQRYKKGEITKRTLLNHQNTRNKLRKYCRTLTFDQINALWLKDFKLHLTKKQKLKLNTAWTHLKDINAYMNLAKEEDNIPCVNPFANGFSNREVGTDVDAITLDELKRLHAYYNSEEIPLSHRMVLGQFLFSCYTGLRISDLKRITIENVVNDTLVFAPKKGERFGKIVKVPLTERAKAFISKELEGDGRIFEKYVDVSSNRILKQIQRVCEIRLKLTNHVGRHSFATLFLELGGSVEVLQKILGHSKISTTMRYVHVQEKRKEEQMANFDALDF